MTEYIRELFQNARIIDFFDVGIIAVFIYMALVWFEKARARFVMTGLFILGFIYIVARLLGLYLTTAVLQGFFAILLIMVVVIFQDEFRRIFERIALWGLIRKKRRFTSFNQNVDILANALVNLSNKKIGALVVIKGKDLLDRHIEGGVPLEGVLTQAMLESIFTPHTPSHDGAVIIEEGQIVKFGCHLPLSMNIQKLGRFGTRHAAALGISERTDAICLVVSEEQGMISIADGEKLKPLKDISSLRIRLEDFYRKRFPPRKKIWSGLVTGHILEKGIAVILACGLWFVFGQRQETIRRDFVIPIEYRNLAAEWIIGEPKIIETSVSLSGAARIFDHFDEEDFKISVDMSQVKEGENELFLSGEFIRKPPGISVINIDPRQINFNIYKMITHDLPIEPVTLGRVPYGYELSKITVYPEKVSVVFPSTISLDDIKVTTEKIDLRKIKETQTLTPKVIISDGAHFQDDKHPDIKMIIEVEKK